MIEMVENCCCCCNWTKLENETYEGHQLGLCSQLGLKFGCNFYCILYEKNIVVFARD